MFWELSPRLPDNCILSADSGTAANWYARDLKIRRGMMASGSGNLATMGPAVPYAVAAKFCFPDRVAIALTGDGAMQMNGLNACITVAKYWKEWSDPRWITLVLNNRDLNQVTWEQRIMTGDIKFDASQDLPDFPYAALRRVASACAASASTTPTRSATPGTRRLRSDRPVVLEAITDPDVPTLPPHITLEQAKNFATSAAQGRPRRRRDHQAGGQGNGAEPHPALTARCRGRRPHGRKETTPSGRHRQRPSAGDGRSDVQRGDSAPARDGSAARATSYLPSAASHRPPFTCSR